MIRSLFAFAPPDYTGEVVTLDPTNSPCLYGCAFPVHALGKGRGPTRYNPRLTPWLRTNRSRFDGVFVHGLWRYISFAAWRTFRRRTPYVVVPHGMLDPYFKRRFPLKHLQRWFYWILSEYAVLRDAYRVLFTTEEECRLAKQSFWLHRWRPLILAIGATVPTQDATLFQASFFTLAPQLKGRRFLLFLGRIHPKKGCDMLISSFLKYAADDPDLHLVMAGPDPQGWSKVLKQSIADSSLDARIHWPGMLTGEAKWGALMASEVFILPSHQENFGIAVAEALACGRPVLLSDKVNIAHEIATDGAGLMEPDTEAGTSRLLERWLRLSSTERTTLGRRGRRTFEERYDMEKNAPTIWRLFDNVTEPSLEHEA